jgi:uncharacterized membrane-anchored protein
MKITDRNSLKPASKVQLSLRQFSRNSRLFEKVFEKVCTKVHKSQRKGLVACRRMDRLTYTPCEASLSFFLKKAYKEEGYILSALTTLRHDT